MNFQADQYRQPSGLDIRVIHATLATEWGGFGFPHYAELDIQPDRVVQASKGSLPATGNPEASRRRLMS